MITTENAAGWQKIANDVSRQRPYPGRYATVVRGKKLRGERVFIVTHMRDQYSTAFRYGGAGNLQMREMKGRAGFVCKVRATDGSVAWVKAPYLACEFTYGHWTEALSDAITMGTDAH